MTSELNSPHNTRDLSEEWVERIHLTTRDITALIPSDKTFILVDDDQVRHALPANCDAILFLERDGYYWGPPPNDTIAIWEFDRLHQSGSSFMVFAWPAFWWLDHYTGLRRYLRSTFKCVLENEHLVVFDLLKTAISESGNELGVSHKCLLTCGFSICIDNPDEFIQNSLIQTGEYEPNVTRLISTILGDGDLFFDVGANIGYHSLVAAAQGVVVHAFEPVPRLADAIRRNVQLNHLESAIHVVEVALSNQAGMATLYVADRLDDGSHSMLAGVEAREIRQILVRTTSLDAYIEEVSSSIPTLVKIDVEGAEALVLDGAARTVPAAEPPIWIFETADRLASQLNESAFTVITRFLASNYRVFRIPNDRGPFSEITTTNICPDLSNYLAVHRDSLFLKPLVNIFVKPKLSSHF